MRSLVVVPGVTAVDGALAETLSSFTSGRAFPRTASGGAIHRTADQPTAKPASTAKLQARGFMRLLIVRSFTAARQKTLRRGEVAHAAPPRRKRGIAVVGGRASRESNNTRCAKLPGSAFLSSGAAREWGFMRGAA